MRRILAVFVVAALVLVATFRFAGWYADTAAMPRYCENPRETMGLVERILTEDEPSGDEARRPYIVAAKLVFLVPQGDGESVADYLSRLEVEITERCGARF